MYAVDDVVVEIQTNLAELCGSIGGTYERRDGENPYGVCKLPDGTRVMFDKYATRMFYDMPVSKDKMSKKDDVEKASGNVCSISEFPDGDVAMVCSGVFSRPKDYIDFPGNFKDDVEWFRETIRKAKDALR